jgi:hypothetical protein
MTRDLVDEALSTSDAGSWCGDPDPRCDTCGAPITTGMMAVFCPRGRACEFWCHDAVSDAFLVELRGSDPGPAAPDEQAYRTAERLGYMAGPR